MKGYTEDFLYGFFFGGLSSVLLNFLFGYRLYKRKTRHYIIGLSFIIITFLTFYIVLKILNLNSIIAQITAPIIVGIICIIKFKKYLRESIISGVAITIFTVLMFNVLLLFNPYIFIKYWNLRDLSNIFIASVPIEECLFAFSLGFGAPMFYDLILGYYFRKPNPKKYKVDKTE